MAPFSGKQKKEQLKAKRAKKRAQNERDKATDAAIEGDNMRTEETTHDSASSASSVGEEYTYGADRAGVRSVFRKETAAELAARRQASYEPLTERQVMSGAGIPYGSWFRMPHAECVGGGGGKSSAGFVTALELPSRGWRPIRVEAGGTQVIVVDDDTGDGAERHVTAEEIAALEARRFARYVRRVESIAARHPDSEDTVSPPLLLSSYERNLDVWRQLWRTVELSDVVVVVLDARYPAVHLHLGLLSYIVQQCKPCVLLLNKIDLVSTDVVERWLAFIPPYLQSLGLMGTTRVENEHQGGFVDAAGAKPEVSLRTFTAAPRPETDTGAEPTLDVTHRQRKAARRRGKMYEQLRAGTVKVSRETTGAQKDDTDSNSSSDEDGYGPTTRFKNMDKAVQEMQKDRQAHRELKAVAGAITELLTCCKAMAARHRRTSGDDAVAVADSANTHIGFVGFPNVGKSSLLNCVRGTKVVSVSATPGHTKHLQTIPLPEEGVSLVDCPGLAMPMLGLPLPLQAVIGTHQIAQTRDPQSGVAYLATHLPLEKLYGLRRPVGAVTEAAWCAYELCEAYAQKRGFFVKHGKGALDIHRAAIALLQEAYEGRLVLFFAPPPLSLLQTTEYRTTIQPNLLRRVLDTSDTA